MRGRISALEDALRTLQASVVDEPHPLLLTDETASTGTRASPGSQSSSDPRSGPPLTREDEEFLDAFGEYTPLRHR